MTINYIDIVRMENLPDCEVTIDTTLSIENIIAIIGTIPDSHVMAQTLKLENEYTGERPVIDPDKEKLAHDICVKHGFKSDNNGVIIVNDDLSPLENFTVKVTDKPSCYGKQLGCEACFNQCPVRGECYE